MNDRTPFTLLQLSDCHVSAAPEAEYRGYRALERLQTLAPLVRELGPDMLVLSGDVSEDSTAESYRRVADVVGPWCEEIAWLPGNHDERAVMEQTLARPGFSAGPLLVRGGWQLVLLDSAWHDRPEGELDDQRLAPLARLSSEKPALVFVHHQPVEIGSPWIDKYPLVESQRLWDRLDAGVVRAVAFGHVHQVYEGEKAGIALLSAPSTVANSLSDTLRFTPSELGPALRWFKLWPDGHWQSGIKCAMTKSGLS